MEVRTTALCRPDLSAPWHRVAWGGRGKRKEKTMTEKRRKDIEKKVNKQKVYYTERASITFFKYKLGQKSGSEKKKFSCDIHLTKVLVVREVSWFCYRGIQWLGRSVRPTPSLRILSVTRRLGPAEEREREIRCNDFADRSQHKAGLHNGIS